MTSSGIKPMPLEIDDGEGEVEVNDSLIEKVRLTVPITDDPTLPVITFRTWLLGPITCFVTSFVSQFFSYRQNMIYIPDICVNFSLLLVGRFLAKTLPPSPIKIPGLNWTFLMNPGPFNIKEHVLLTILATSSNDKPFGLTILTLTKLFYHINLNIWAMCFMILTSQLLGYGFAGICRKLLIDSPYMWYPYTLMDVSFFRTMHEVEEKPKGELTKYQLFLIATISSFAYAVIPGYFFPSISALSIVCLIWKKSITAQIIGSSRNGLGIGSITLDWNVISSLGNPFAIPLDTIINYMIGFILFLYVLTPIAYWTNSYNARRFPFSSYSFYDKNGQTYNVSRIINQNDTTFNHTEYENYSKMHISTINLFNNGFGFASITAMLSHFLLFNLRESIEQTRQTYTNSSRRREDVHNRLMKKYNQIPQWWFIVILVSMISLSIFCCEGFGKQLQLPYWGILLACLLVLVFFLPNAILLATTGSELVLYEVSEMLLGYIYPYRPVANMVFKTYSLSTLDHALSFLSDFKLAHYMKIPPKAMFVAQITGTLISSLTSFFTTWWIFSSIKNICDIKKLPKGSPWTCPGQHQIFTSSVIWGVVGPKNIFFPNGIYSKMCYFFIIGAIAPFIVWAFSQMFPNMKWIRSINVVNILGSINSLKIYGSVNYWSWFIVGIFFNLVVYKKHKEWWAKYNYTLANGLDIGVAFFALLTTFTLNLNDIYGVDWWGFDVGDHCPLATCPTTRDVSVDGC